MFLINNNYLIQFDILWSNTVGREKKIETRNILLNFNLMIFQRFFKHFLIMCLLVYLPVIVR